MKSVTARYSKTTSDVHAVVAELTEQVFSHFAGGIVRRRIERVQRARSLGLGHFSDKDKARTIDNRIRRILLVLRGALNDSPYRRDWNVWRYMDYERFPIIPPVDDLETFEPGDSTRCAATDIIVAEDLPLGSLPYKILYYARPILAMYAKIIGFLTQECQSLQGKLFRYSHVKEITSAYMRRVRSSLLSGRPRRSTRQETYEEYLRAIVAKHLPNSTPPGPSDYLEHRAEQEHHDVDALMNIDIGYVRPHQSTDTPIETVQWDTNRLYALARLRSHMKLCCWSARNHNSQGDCRQPLPGNEISIVDYLKGPDPEIGVLAWLCRGEVGRNEIQELKESPVDSSSLWNFLFTGPGASDENRTNILLLLLENGVEIYQMVERQGTSK